MSSLKPGYILSHPDPGEEVVVTGIAGYFPESNSVAELQENLFNKVDMITFDDRRWPYHSTEAPHGIGKINNIFKFDASFFGVDYETAHNMEPMSRLLLERTYEAIIDAGINPEELRNTRTGVFVGCYISESDVKLRCDNVNTNPHGIIGCARSSLVINIAQWLGVTGPTLAVDTACSSAAYAIEMGFKAIRNGMCDTAIVCGSHICLHTEMSTQLYRTGILSPESKSKSFDESSDGYGRSETVAVCILQRAKDSRRAYAQILHAKTNCDGYKDNGHTHPSGEMQEVLLNQVYNESMVDPNTVEYLEAHGTGTAVGDVEELKVVHMFVSKKRSKPFLLGCIKSNIGHSEAASGMGSLFKLCIAYHSGYIPPNLHFSNPRESIKDLIKEEKLKIVTEKQSWDRGLAACSGFGFGGANCHILCKNIAKEKVNKGLPKDDMPRLVCVSGRTQSAVERILNSLEAKAIDVEEIRLWHAIHEHNINGHPYRGYVLLHSSPSESVTLKRSIQSCSNFNRPICFVVSGMNLDGKIAKELLKIPAFAAAIDKGHNALVDKGINLKELVVDPYPTFNDYLGYVVATTAMQIAIIEVLRIVGVKPDYYIAFNLGEICCAYANGIFTMEQALIVAYYYGLVLDTAKNFSVSANTEIKNEKDKYECPPKVCVKRSDITNISRPEFVMENIINEQIALEDVLDEVTLNGVNNSQNVKNEQELLSYLQEIISECEQWPQKWITGPQNTQKYCGKFTAEKFYKILMGSNVLLKKEVLSLIPQNAITIEIGSNKTTVELLNKTEHIEEDGTLSFQNQIEINLINDSAENALHELLNTLGRLYEDGVNLKLANIYPPVSFPVSQGTPMLSHLVEWNHQGDMYHVLNFEKFLTKSEAVERMVPISIDDPNWEYLKGHVIDGRNLFPGTGYLSLVWGTLALSMRLRYQYVPVVFENVVFHRATTIPKKGTIYFNICIQPVTGEFEVTENKITVATGVIYVKKNIAKQFHNLPSPLKDSDTSANRITQRDFYKKIRLRGYQYSGIFKGVLSCDVNCYHSRVTWHSSVFWDVYLDNILQTMIASLDTRFLYVPIGFEKVSIDTELHYKILRHETGECKNAIDVFYDKQANICRSGGVEIRGLRCTLISRRPDMNTPICETYEFVPNIGETVMTFQDALRINVQIIFENLQALKFKVIEIMEEQSEYCNIQPLLVEVSNILSNFPQVWADLTLYTKETIEFPSDIILVTKTISKVDNAILVMGVNLLKRPEVLKDIEKHLNKNGFILSIEKDRHNLHVAVKNFDIITSYETDVHHFVLLKRKQDTKNKVFINVDNIDNTFSWIDIAKKNIEEGKKVVFYGQDDISGVVGLVNCLRREPGGMMIHGLLITDPKAPVFDPNIEFYKAQLEKDLAINVFQDGQWGTYRHFLIKEHELKKSVEDAFVNIETIGDLSSLKWFEGYYYGNTDQEQIPAHIYYSALNFRDVVIASGRVPVDAVSRKRLLQQYIQGFEFSGKTENGSRVIGTLPCQCIGTKVYDTRDLLFGIPDEWSLEEAATVPVAYCTVYLAFVYLGKMKYGESVLIHAGTGAVGQAAIYLALYYGCNIFTTVGSPEKRELIKKLFPQLKDSHIGSTRDIDFEEMVHRETNGKGVDLVLNSLADEKLLASIRCLGHRGRFLELGKYDIVKNTKIDMYLYEKEICIQGVMFDFVLGDEYLEKMLINLVIKGIIDGAVQPLTYCIFEKDELEAAYRYMAAGKHTGKVLIKIRDDPKDRIEKPTPITMEAIRRFNCTRENVYVLIGGLGGFGLELADWLVMRGARKLVLVSRRGVSIGYQSRRISIWESYGCKIQVLTHDVTTSVGCTEILKFANSMGPVDAIFNLAAVLKDAPFQQQTPEMFKASFEPKAVATKLLDEISRELCPKLRQFVVFSSISCGRGNVSQSNYGMANSVMERICEKRRREGYPGLAIQYGAIGDVGVFADLQTGEMDREIHGIVPQRIVSCLQTLDKFLVLNAPIGSTFVLAEKKVKGSHNKTIVEAVAQIVGIKNPKNVSYQMKLAELGMDSMMGLEIKQTLERDFEIILTADEVKSLSLARLIELSTKSEQLKPVGDETMPEGDDAKNC